MNEIRGASRNNFEKEEGKKNTNLYLNIFETFENILNEIDVEEKFKPEVIQKLKSIQKTLKKKLKKLSVADEPHLDEEVKESKSLDVGLFNSSKSMENLLSKLDGTITNPLYFKSLYNKFIIKVDCPFCSQTYANKFNLIKHIDKYCKSCKLQLFQKNIFKPLSAFQILPFKALKCNICRPDTILNDIKEYFMHTMTNTHRENYLKASATKNYTESVFCSCCKIFIPSNYTQLNFHMKNEEHEINCEKNKGFSFFKKRKISLVYLPNKKFKCTLCSANHTFSNDDSIFSHIFSSAHLKAKKKFNILKNIIYCDICEVELTLTDLNHFESAGHKETEILQNKENFEWCFFCGSKCDNLNELYCHMTEKCLIISNLRENENYKNAKPLMEKSLLIEM